MKCPRCGLEMKKIIRPVNFGGPDHVIYTCSCGLSYHNTIREQFFMRKVYEKSKWVVKSCGVPYDKEKMGDNQ